MPAVQISAGIHLVPGTHGANLYLLAATDGYTLIDTGLPGNARPVMDCLTALGAIPRDLRRIILTHGHPDHTGSAAALRRLTGAEVMAHPADCVQADGSSCLRIVSAPSWLRLPAWRCPVDRFLEEGTTLPPGLRVIAAPGHTPGGVCLMAEREGVLFIGDLLSRRGRCVSRSVPFPETDLAQYHASMERIAALDFEAVAFGHGAPLLHGAREVVRRAADWYADSPPWRRLLQRVPGPLRFGYEAGYRFL